MVVMMNRRERKSMLNPPTQIFRNKLRLTGLNNGLDVRGKLQRVKNHLSIFGI